MTFIETVKTFFACILFPWTFMGISARHIPLTVRNLISTGDYGALFSPSAFRDALFGNFWATVGPFVKSSAEIHVIPLLEGRVSGGKVHDEVMETPVSGTVLEIGAGSGMWADVFSKIDGGVGGTDHTDDDEGLRRRKRSNLTKIYGIEPNPTSAAALRQRVRDVGLGDVYEVIPAGIEDLPTRSGTTIEPGSVDCIVSILCLCSIPDQEKNIKALYKLLKPGGRWYVYEHVKAERGGILLSLYQRITNVPWSFFVGSCRLCRPTGANLRNAGHWQKIDLVPPPEAPPYQVLPHILGTLTK